MIRKLDIEGFRGFGHFEMRDLGRINLLVGTNNCGKTSILEAIEMLSSKNDISIFVPQAIRRGERFPEWSNSRGVSENEIEIRHLFHGHEITEKSGFRISSFGETSSQEFEASIIRRRELQKSLPFDPDENDMDVENTSRMTGLALKLRWRNSSGKISKPDDDLEIGLRISSRGGLSSNVFKNAGRVESSGYIPNRFISTGGLFPDDVIGMFEEISLTEEEEFVLDALRTIEPSIERLASRGSERRRFASGERGGIMVKTRSSHRPIPIGSMGDGMWRLLGISLALVSSRNGILLIDEIDTGLHFSVMEKLWQLVKNTASRLNVQVFATTHSRDCYESLAAISRRSVSNDSEVTIQRLERGKQRAIAFNEQEVVIAAERGMEVR